MHWKPALEQHGCGVVMPHESRWCCGLSDEVLEFYFYWLEKERWPPSLATMIAAAGVAKKLGEEFCVKLTCEQRVWTKSHTPTQSIKNTDWWQHLKTNPFCIFSFRFVERTRHNSFSVCAFSTVSMWSSIRTVQNLGDDLSEGGINRTCHGKKLEMSREIKSALHDVTDHLQLLTFNADLIISHLSLSISNTHTCCITFAHMHSFSLVGLSGTHVYVNTHTHTRNTRRQRLSSLVLGAVTLVICGICAVKWAAGFNSVCERVNESGGNDEHKHENRQYGQYMCCHTESEPVL